MKKAILITLILFSVGTLIGCKLPSSEIKNTPVYQVTFDKNDNNATGTMAVQKIKSKASAQLTINSFTKLGSSFAGWAKTADGTVSFPDMADYTMGKENVTLYAKWNANPYTITFNANGGIGADYTQTIVCGSSENLTENSFTKTGSSFAGWAISANGEVKYSDSVKYTMGTENVTLYAKWSTIPSYTITFKANGGIGDDYTQSIISGLSINLLSNSFTNTGLYFAGWATTDIGTVTFTDCASYAMGTENTTLYAVWSINPSYTITFKANEGLGSDYTQSLVSGVSANLTVNTFTRTGYTFTGWSTTETGPVTLSQSASYTMGTENVTLYAKWTINPSYTITFKANGGVGTDYTQTIVSGVSANLMANTFTRAGYTFAGWNTMSNGSGLFYADKANYTSGISDLYLYAQWSPNINRIFFYSNGGSGYTHSCQFLATGASANLETNWFTKEGYTFIGWNTMSNGSGLFYADNANYTSGISDFYLYAQWSPNNNAIIFDSNGGTGYMGNQIMATESSANLNVNTFTKAGYSFAGWQEGNNSTIYQDADIYSMGRSDTTLFAQWSGPGLNWIEHDLIPSPFNNTNIRAQTFANGIFVMLSYKGATISSDGISWITYPIPGNPIDWSSITYGNGRFVAVGSDSSGRVTATSPDGITWTFQTLPSSYRLQSVAFGNNYFISVGHDGVAVRSLDGVIWTPIDLPTPKDQMLKRVFYLNSRFIICPETGHGAFSTDGITWTATTLPVFGFQSITSMAFGNGIYVGLLTPNIVAISSNGIDWSIRSLRFVSNSVLGSTPYSKIAFGNGVFVISAGQGVAVSQDGINWSTTLFRYINDYYLLSFGNNIFSIFQSGHFITNVATSQ